MRSKQKTIYSAIVILFATFFISAFLPIVNAQTEYQDTENPVFAVYLTGIGCHNCAITDPILLTQSTQKNPDLIVFDYEVFKSKYVNELIKKAYFKNYLKTSRTGVPFLIFSKDQNYLGKFKVLDGIKEIKNIKPNAFPKSDGTTISLEKLDLSQLPGKVNIWTKNRVLMSGTNADPHALKSVLLKSDIVEALKSIPYKKMDPVAVDISGGKVGFKYAVKIGDWILQWNGAPPSVDKKFQFSQNLIAGILFAILFLGFLASVIKIEKKQKGFALSLRLQDKKIEVVVVFIALIALCVFFMLAQNASPKFLEQAGYNMPLPLFTFLIALVDGFNPCNMFVLTCLLVLLISSSDDKMRLYVVSLTFVFMVFIIYFLFMAAWLNVFKYISFITPLRIAIGVLALVAGFINCKELLFFKKGVSLTIQDEHKGPLLRRIKSMREVIQNGTMPILITSSIGLATLASLIELPCTAGFPIIYTGILSGKALEKSIAYYGYIFYYNLVYVLPLLVIVSIFIYTFKARHISQRQVEIIKFIGGIIMVLLGIVLLVNPGLVGLALQ